MLAKLLLFLKKKNKSEFFYKKAVPVMVLLLFPALLQNRQTVTADFWLWLSANGWLNRRFATPNRRFTTPNRRFAILNVSFGILFSTFTILFSTFRKIYRAFVAKSVKNGVSVLVFYFFALFLKNFSHINIHTYTKWG